MGTRTFPRMSPPYTRRSGWYASTEFRNLRKHTSEPCKSLTKKIRYVPTRKPSAVACHIVLGRGPGVNARDWVGGVGGGAVHPPIVTGPQEFIFHPRIHRAQGLVDQLEDRYLGMVEAVCSNPTRSTFPSVHTV